MKHYTAGLLLTLTAVITVGCSATESLDSTFTSADAVPSSTSTADPTTTTTTVENSAATSLPATTTTTTPSADTSLLTDAYPDGTWAYMGGGRCGDQAWVLDGPASDIDPEQRLNPTLITLDWGDGEWVETLQVPLNVDGSGEPAETAVRGAWTVLDGLDDTAIAISVETDTRPYGQLLVLDDNCSWELTPVLTTCGVQMTPVSESWSMTSVVANLTATFDQHGLVTDSQTGCEDVGSQRVVWNTGLGMAEVDPQDRWCPNYSESAFDGVPLDSPMFTTYFIPIVPCTTGSDVAGAQAALDEAGFPTEADGLFGPGTIRSLAAYQLANGLNLTGVLDRSTWEHLIGLVDVPIGECPDDVDPAECDY